MKKILFVFLFLMSCASVSKPTLVEPTQDESCDIDNECCLVNGERWCCFDDGKKIRCAKDQHVPLGDVE